jgi:hypothetical protein
MLVDHLIEVPETIEERFNYVAQDIRIFDGIGAENGLYFGHEWFHSIRGCI